MNDRKKKIAQASKLLQEGLETIFSGNNFKQYLETLSRLPGYSYKNLILIAKQCPLATRLHTFRGWIPYGRCVSEGEETIRIRAPYQKKKDALEDEDDVRFRWINLFDISQTQSIFREEGDSRIVSPIIIPQFPFKSSTLEGTVENFESFLNAIKRISPYIIEINKLDKKEVRGWCDFVEKKIRISSDLSQLHTIKTTIHEVAHSYLHSTQVIKKQQREIEAESIAFVVCNYFDLDTSEYSFDYVASFGMNQEKNDICNFLDRIQKAASYFVNSIEGALEEQRISYDSNTDLLVLINRKRVQSYFNDGKLVYLVYPGEGECFASDNKEIKEHDGPFAVEKETWQKTILQAA